jgi:hypothetical protein
MFTKAGKLLLTRLTSRGTSSNIPYEVAIQNIENEARASLIAAGDAMADMLSECLEADEGYFDEIRGLLQDWDKAVNGS